MPGIMRSQLNAEDLPVDRNRRLHGLVLFAVLIVVLTGVAARTPSSGRLLALSDMPHGWTDYAVSSTNPPSIDNCGHKRPSGPSPVDVAADAWAKDAQEGPIFGERIERFASPAEAKRAATSSSLRLPCTWTSADGAHLETVRVAAPKFGANSRIELVKNLDPPGSFNYEVAMRSGDTLVLAVLNSRGANRPLLDRLLAKAWRAATGDRRSTSA
jgi:hypothetical protein